MFLLLWKQSGQWKWACQCLQYLACGIFSCRICWSLERQGLQHLACRIPSHRRSCYSFLSSCPSLTDFPGIDHLSKTTEVPISVKVEIQSQNLNELSDAHASHHGEQRKSSHQDSHFSDDPAEAGVSDEAASSNIAAFHTELMDASNSQDREPLMLQQSDFSLLSAPKLADRLSPVPVQNVGFPPGSAQPWSGRVCGSYQARSRV